MFRNEYDSDVSIFSPQGRLHQVEYAMEAVKRGSAIVGVKGRDCVVLVALGKSSELSVALRKIIPVDEHLGISVAGITADARALSLYLRTSCMNYRYTYDAIHPVERLISTLGSKMQETTQRYNRRPYGVGLLVAGYDQKGPSLYQVMPSAVIYECKAQCIGARAQGSRSYLERNLQTFLTCSNEQLICHGILALKYGQPAKATLSGQEKVPSQVTISVAIVGKDQPFKILTDEEVEKYTKMASEMGAFAQPQPSFSPDDDGNEDDDRRPTLQDRPAADPQPDVAVMDN